MFVGFLEQADVVVVNMAFREAAVCAVLHLYFDVAGHGVCRCGLQDGVRKKQYGQRPGCRQGTGREKIAQLQGETLLM